MWNLQVHHTAGPDLFAHVQALLADVTRATGRQPLSDHLLLDLRIGGGDGFVAVTARDDRDDEVVGYAQASSGNDRSVLELVLHPARATPELGPELLAAALTTIGRRGGGIVDWWVAEPDTAAHDTAGALGMTVARTLLQMRRGLPTGLPVEVDTRAFIPGRDDAGWLEVNNRAFADHGEQGGWTEETLRHRVAEEWFDPDGLRIHERDGRIAAFCWTKVHPAAGPDPAMGEIYVIAVDPRYHGLGLGRQLTLAGLDHLAGAGLDVAMLWVDADNHAAVGLYEQLEFAMATTKVAFTVDQPALDP